MSSGLKVFVFAYIAPICSAPIPTYLTWPSSLDMYSQSTLLSPRRQPGGCLSTW